jgi:hypothetical protein
MGDINHFTFQRIEPVRRCSSPYKAIYFCDTLSARIHVQSKLIPIDDRRAGKEIRAVVLSAVRDSSSRMEDLRKTLANDVIEPTR